MNTKAFVTIYSIVFLELICYTEQEAMRYLQPSSDWFKKIHANKIVINEPKHHQNSKLTKTLPCMKNI